MTQFFGAKDSSGMQQAFRFKLIFGFLAFIPYFLVCIVFPKQVIYLMLNGNLQRDLILPEGVHLLSDIIGSRVVDEEGNDIGIVEDILERPAANVYVIRGDREILVPSVPEFIKKVDTDEKIVTVRLIEGM